MKLKIFTVACLTLLGFATQAQETQPINPRHEFSIGLGGGLSTLMYKSDIANQTNGFGGQAGLGYTLFFSKHFGITTGVDINLFNSKSSLDDGWGNSYAATSMGGLLPGESFTFSYAFNDFTEHQQAWYLTIPLMLQFQTGGKNKFYAAVGAKFGFPLSATYKTDDYTLSTQGYFPSDGRTYNDLPEYGLGKYENQKSDGDLDLDMAYFAALELGMKWAVGVKNSLYTGIYLDYGLNNVQKTDNQTFVEYTGSEEHPMNSLVQSSISNEAVTDKIAPMALGIKLKFAFGCGDVEAKAKAAAEKAKQEEAARQQAQAAEAARQKQLADEAAAKQKAQEEEAARQKALADVAALQQNTASDSLAKAQEAQRLAQQQAANQQQGFKSELEKPVDNYKINEVVLTPAQIAQLDEKIALLKQNPDVKVFIYGHTCDLGGDPINQRIGLGRAEKAKAYLISKGISPKRILGTASKLDREPLVPNTNEDNRKKNRRVQLVLQNN